MTGRQMAAALREEVAALDALRTAARRGGAAQPDVLECLTRALWELECAEEIVRGRIKAAKK